MYVNYLRNKCFSTSTQTTEEATTTTQETTTEQPTTIITTTEHDIPESYEGRTIILLNTKKTNFVSSRFNSFVDYTFNIHLHGNSDYLGHLCFLEKVST